MMSKQRTIIKGGIRRGGNFHYARNSVIYIFENICFAWQFFFEFCLPQIKAENIHNKLEAVIVFFIVPLVSLVLFTNKTNANRIRKDIHNFK